MAKGRIEINEAMCKGCKLCTYVCPYNLLEMGSHFNAKGYNPAVLVDPNLQCTGCTLCAMMCPDAVITVYREVKVKAPLLVQSVQAISLP